MVKKKDNLNVVAIIPARGGSKSIPNKNIFSFCGKPLLAWSIEQAKQSRYVCAVYVSTNDSDIANVASSYGAKVLRRPNEISGDLASSEEALTHALDQLGSKEKIDLVVFLQATSPVREASDIDDAIKFLIAQKADSLFSAAKLSDFCLWKKTHGRFTSYSFDYLNRGLRQGREPLYLENGSIYLFRPEVLRKYKNRLGGKIEAFLMPLERSFEIDTMEEIPLCEYFMQKMLSLEKSKVSCREIDLIIYDFDGVMTNNRVIVDQEGREEVVTNRSDGLAVSLIKKLGIRQIIVSTESNPVVAKRAEKIGIPVYHDIANKKECVLRFCKEQKIDLKRVMYVGNDVNDREAMRAVGWPACPQDAHEDIQRISKIVIQKVGGSGVVRELLDLLTKKEF